MTDKQIADALRAALKKSPESQAEIARRASTAPPTASGYVTADGDSLSDRFKPLAFFIELARSSSEAFVELMPILGQPKPEEIPDPVLNRRVELVKRAHKISGENRVVNLQLMALEEAVAAAEVA